MKRTLVLVITVATVMMFVVSTAAAATSQNLSWGVADNDQFNFTLDAVSEAGTFHEDMYFRLTDAPPVIPNIITDWSQIPEVDLVANWANDTPLGFAIVIFGGLALFGMKFAVPTGNWTLMTEVVKTSDDWYDNTTFTTNSAYWGMSFTGASGGLRSTLSASYLKSDGFLAKYQIKTTNTTSSTDVYSFQAIRTGLPNDLIVMLQDNILLIGIGVGVVVILGAVVCMKRK